MKPESPSEIAEIKRIGDLSLRILNRTVVNSLIKECFVEMGAGQYATAIPFAEELIRPELAPKAQKLEALVKKLITSEIFQQAVARHAAHVAQQNNKNRQAELFAVCVTQGTVLT